MKNKKRILFAGLFASLSLCVLSGVNFATKNNAEPLETNAGGTGEFWVPINDLSNFPAETPVMFAAKCSNTWYRLTELAGNQTGKNAVASFSPTVYSCADGDVLQATLHSTNRYFYLYQDGNKLLTTSKYIVFKTGSTHYTTHRATGCNWSVSGYSYYNIYASAKASGNCDSNTKYTISGGYPVNVGYTEKGLNLPIYAFKDSSSGTPYFVIASQTAASKKTAYQAKLYAKIDSYNTITLNDNGGSNGSGSVRAFKYMKFQNAKVPTRTGYTFNGYFTAKSGGTKVINADGTGVSVWTGTSDTTYYAQWSIKSYNLTANANGGTFSSTSGWTKTGSNYYKTINYGTNYSFPGVERTGYTLDGWYTAASGGNKVTTSTTIGAGSVTVYAHWSAIKSTVTLNSQNATTIGTESVTATYDSAMPAIILPTKTGFTFGGYYTGENGTGTQYYDLSGTSVHICDFTEATTLYAKWTPNTYHVSLSSQGGTGGDTIADTVFGQAVPSVTAPTRTGYTFKGYFSELNGKGIKYINEDGSSTGTAWTTASDSTIYAYWTGNQYTVTFNKGIGTGGSDSVTATFDASMPTIILPINVGYTFEGYFDASSGGEKYYDSEGNSAKSWDKASDTTLYAQWTRDEYSITYENLQGATHSNPTGYNVESDAITLSDPTVRPGHIFVGWFDALEGGNQVTSIVKGSTGNITVYAHWSHDISYQPILNNAIGGWINDNGVKKQIVAFGFTFSGEIFPENDSDFGIIVYRSLDNGVEYAKGTVAGLIANEGRFYMYLIIDESKPVTCYAKAFVKFNGEYIYSSLESATGNLSGREYIL